MRRAGSLQRRVLDVLASEGAAMTPAQVRDALGGDLAYTTVMTVLARLADSGVLIRRRVGRAYAYAAPTDEADLTARRMHRLLDIGEDRGAVLARFVSGLSAEDERILTDLLTRIEEEQA